MLTTVAIFRKFAKISQTDTAFDEQLKCIIVAASEAIESYTNRIFELDTYIRWVDGTGRKWLFLDEYPVRTISLAAVAGEDIGDITYRGSSEVATVSFDGTTFTFLSFDTSGNEVSQSIAIATNKTMSVLKTAVDGLTDSWDMTVTGGRENDPVKLVKPAASSFAVDGDSFRFIFPLSGTAVQRADRSERAIVRLEGGFWPSGSRNVFAFYTAGYTLPDEGDNENNGTLPNDLVMVTNLIVQDYLDNFEKDGTVKSEKIGDYSYTLNDTAVQSAVINRRRMLDPYKKVTA